MPMHLSGPIDDFRLVGHSALFEFLGNEGP